MIAPAHNGSPTMSVLGQHPLFPILMGPSGIQSKDDDHNFAASLPGVSGQEVGIIAGCVPLDPIGWFSMPWPNDGKTTVEGTKLDGMKDHTVVPASHDTILTNPAALYQTGHFLKHGQFWRAFG
jgi:triacylglycerol lipase